MAGCGTYSSIDNGRTPSVLTSSVSGRVNNRCSLVLGTRRKHMAVEAGLRSPDLPPLLWCTRSVSCREGPEPGLVLTVSPAPAPQRRWPHSPELPSIIGAAKVSLGVGVCWLQEELHSFPKEGGVSGAAPAPVSGLN